MLVDTDLLIWFMRGHERAAAALNRLPQISLSVVTYMELVQGMRSKHELQALRAALAEWQARIL